MGVANYCPDDWRLFIDSSKLILKCVLLHNRNINGVDLKMVCILLGHQLGYTKYSCFLCHSDSRAKSEHWLKKDWPIREQMVIGQKNIIKEPLIERSKIIFPPLHIKLGLMKQFVKALNKDGDCFKYICKVLLRLSSEKLKAGIFN